MASSSSIPDLDIKINNICGKFNSNIKINLNELFEKNIDIFWSKILDRSKFSGLICKYFNKKENKKLNLTFLILRTGNIIICGGKTFKKIQKASKDLIKVLRSIDSQAKIVNLKYTNICCSCDFGVKIDLIKLYNDKKLQKIFI